MNQRHTNTRSRAPRLLVLAALLVGGIAIPPTACLLPEEFPYPPPRTQPTPKDASEATPEIPAERATPPEQRPELKRPDSLPDLPSMLRCPLVDKTQPERSGRPCNTDADCARCQYQRECKRIIPPTENPPKRCAAKCTSDQDCAILGGRCATLGTVVCTVKRP